VKFLGQGQISDLHNSDGIATATAGHRQRPSENVLVGSDVLPLVAKAAAVVR
jgi:hypothetical protein